MKKILFLLFLIISSATFAQSKTDCSGLKKCRLKSLIAEDTSTIIIDNEQYTQLYDDGNFIKSKINWIADCEAEITISEITIDGFPLDIGEKLKLKVDTIKDNIADFTITMQGELYASKFKISSLK